MERFVVTMADGAVLELSGRNEQGARDRAARFCASLPAARAGDVASQTPVLVETLVAHTARKAEQLRAELAEIGVVIAGYVQA